MNKFREMMEVLPIYTGKLNADLTEDQKVQLRCSARCFRDFCRDVAKKSGDCLVVKVRADYLDMARNKKVRPY